MQPKKQIALLMILGMLMPTIGKTSGSKKLELPPAPIKAESQCDAVLDKCRKAVDSQLKLNHAQQKQIQAQDELIGYQKDRIVTLEKENKSILKSPWLWMGVGLIGGQLLLNGVKR